jgi:hypothetical protein
MSKSKRGRRRTLPLALSISHPVGRGACARPPTAACQAAEACAIPARDSSLRSPSFGSASHFVGHRCCETHARWPSARTFQTGVEGALPSCPSISQANRVRRQRPRTVEVMAGHPIRCAWDSISPRREIPVSVRASQIWPRWFNSAFVSRSFLDGHQGCKL